MRKNCKNLNHELIDRFGDMPEQVVDLLNSVRIKWIANKNRFGKSSDETWQIGRLFYQ